MRCTKLIKSSVCSAAKLQLIFIISLVSLMQNLQNLLPSAMKLRRLCFTPLCHSVHRGVSASVHAGIPILPHQPPGGTPTPGKHTPGKHTPWEMAAAVDGMHPTGMHSC